MKIKFHKSLGSLCIDLEVEGSADECAAVVREIASNVAPGEMDGIRKAEDDFFNVPYEIVAEQMR